MWNKSFFYSFFLYIRTVNTKSRVWKSNNWQCVTNVNLYWCMSKYNSLKLNLVTKEYSSDLISLKKIFDSSINLIRTPDASQFDWERDQKIFEVELQWISNYVFVRNPSLFAFFVFSLNFLRVFFVFEDCSGSSSRLWRLDSVDLH